MNKIYIKLKSYPILLLIINFYFTFSNNYNNDNHNLCLLNSNFNNMLLNNNHFTLLSNDNQVKTKFNYFNETENIMNLNKFNYTKVNKYLRKENFNDLLYVESSYLIFNSNITKKTNKIGNNNLSNIAFNNINLIINNEFYPYILYKIYWYLPKLADVEYIKNSWFFYGISHSKLASYNNTHFYFIHDLYICTVQININYKKCEDYIMTDNISVTLNNINYILINNTFRNNFNPTKDLYINGLDSIIYYNTEFIFNSLISPYEALLKLDLKVSLNKYDSIDNDLNLNNNLTIFYGNFELYNENKIYKTKFNVKDLHTIYLHELFSIVFYLRPYCMLLFLINLIFII